ncbi:hypothetical protein L1987_06442 [Smallanthus sonchifolius]|uniref:Uncharacterized protein n=1 Tax=Smallanthus sonchifolius TaxID=185202 RepID=A0ACB9JY50_9ASTR|nr:hypothetical protein L1987_06442 [Smallanthus sonchifolius]
MQQEVSKIEKISNKDFIENKIFEDADVYEQESEDPFFKKKFVKQPQQSDVKGKSNQYQENRYPGQHVRFQSRSSYQQKEKRFVDPSLTKPFVKPNSFVNHVDKPRNDVKSMVFVNKDVYGSFQVYRTYNSSVKKIVKKNDVSQQVPRVQDRVSQRQVPVQSNQHVPVKFVPQSDEMLSKPQRRRRNKQLQKLLLHLDSSNILGNDTSLFKGSKNSGMGNSKSVSQKSVTGKVELDDGVKVEQSFGHVRTCDTSMDLERNFVPRPNVVAMDGPIQDPVIPNSPREGVMEDESDSESTKSDDNDPDAVRILVDRRPQPALNVSKQVKMVARKKTTGPSPELPSKGKRLMDEDDDYNPDEDIDQTNSKTKKQRVSADVSTPPGPTVISSQVTPDTQRLLDELINTPPVSTSGSPSLTILVSTSNVSPSRSRQTTRSTSSLRDENVDHTNMQLQIDSLTASLENALKQLAAQGESSYRQETVIIPKGDDDDTEGAQGKDEQPIASSMPGVSLASESNAQGDSSEGNKGKDQQVNENVDVGENIDKETLECLIDLDEVLIDLDEVLIDERCGDRI